MKVLFDTNVIIDAITERYSNYKNAQSLILKATSGEIKGYVCSNQLTDIYYILRKYVNKQKQKAIIRAIVETFTVLPLLPSDVKYCLNSDIEDYEDSILDEIAKVNTIKYLVTSNTEDFKKAKSTVLSPKELCTLLSIENN